MSLSNRQRRRLRKSIPRTPRGSTGAVGVGSPWADYAADGDYAPATDEGRRHGPNRDGLRSVELEPHLVKAGKAYRLCYDAALPSLGSCLGRVGEVRSAPRWGELDIGVDAEGKLVRLGEAAELQRIYLGARLRQLEAAVLAEAGGLALGTLQRVAGARMTIAMLAGSSGHARAVRKGELIAALEVVAKVLRIAGS